MMRRQSSLGRPTPATGGFNTTNRIERAEIVKVNRETSTVDIRLLSNGELITSKDAIYGVRLMKKFGGYNKETGTSYGEQVSYHEGDIVIVGYLDSKYASPVVLGSLDYLNPTDHPIQEDDSDRTITSYPDMTYEKRYDNGNWEKTYPQGYETISSQEITANFSGHSIENLSQRNKSDKKPFGMFSTVFSYLKRFKTGTGDFIHAILSNGTVINKLETENSSIGSKIEGNVYTLERVEGANQSSLSMNSTSLTLHQKIGGTSSITLTDGNSLSIDIDGKASITISSSGEIVINTTNSISMSAKSGINISSEKEVSINSSKKVSISAPKIDIG